MKNTQEYPIIIVGGGLVGAILAHGLAQSGLKVCVVERQPLDQLLAVQQDGRASAIAQGSQQILADFGLWSRLMPHAEPILDILISDNHQPWFVHFPHTLVGEQPMGYIIENTKLRRELVAACVDHPGITWHQGEVESLQLDADTHRVMLKDGLTLSARLVVGADGRQSQARALQGIQTRNWDYRHKAIVTTVTHAEPHQGMAHEYFFPQGPLALLPMQGGHQSSVVWSLPPAQAERLYSLDQEDFNTAINHQFGGRLGQLTQHGPRWIYPLSGMVARQYTAPRFALVGDAAHVMHPVAGQGLNLGIRDVQVLHAEVTRAWQVGLDLGSTPILDIYPQQRWVDALSMLAATDQCVRLFGLSRLGFPYLRGAAMGLLQRIPSIKKRMVKRAMGA